MRSRSIESVHSDQVDKCVCIALRNVVDDKGPWQLYAVSDSIDLLHPFV